MRYVVSDKLDRPRIVIGHCGHCEEDKEKKDYYTEQIEDKTIKNTNFREVLSTNEYSQLVVMSLKPGEEIGEEVHKDTDQFFRIEKGKGKFVFKNGEKEVGDGDVVIIPAGTKHNVVNTGSEDLKLYTIYSPPNHPDGTIHKTKKDAEKAHEEED
jgi:mannose-6-phosphate isomerase-like protein (cupin superfamily)